MYPRIGNPQDYTAALYLRLSKEDDNGDDENSSESIKNQKELLEGYAKKEKLKYKVYADDGFSGGNSDRPDFERMLADIATKKINMVITKDMSRLSRDCIDSLSYIQRIFPEQRVRYIALLDGIDTGTDSLNNDSVMFKALFNDWFAKDVSRKVTATKREKQNRGLFIGWRAPYGYVQSAADKNKLEIDPEVVDNVRYMFNLAAQGSSIREIAMIFNKAGIQTPAAYKGVKLSEKRKSPYRGKWSSERVSAMLQNEVYLGHMVQRRMKKVSYKSKKCIRLPKEEWVIVKNTHEPIIDQETFDKIALLIKSRNKTRQRTHDYLLRGLIHCHECDYPLAVIMRVLSGNRPALYTVCRTYQRFTKLNECTCHCIRVETITDAVLAKVREICERYVALLDMDDITNEAKQMMLAYQKRKQNSLVNIKANLEATKSKIDRVYNDRLSGTLEEGDFQRIYKRLKDEQADLQNRLQSFDEANGDSTFGTPKVEELVRRFLEAEEVSRELIVSMIEKITLTESKELHVHFNFKELEVA